MIRNVLTVDVEDWCHSIYLQNAAISFSDERITRNSMSLVSLFRKHGVKATFFVLGEVAERVPPLIKQIREEGHEIASHGYNHQVLDTMDEDEIRRDIMSTHQLLMRTSGGEVKGYRAPAWSMPKNKKVVVDALQTCGYEYDSSCAAFSVPFIWQPTGRGAQPYWLDQGRRILEIPPTSFSAGLARLPVGGGVSLRLYPYEMTRQLIKWCNQAGRSVIVYVHPWDLDTRFNPIPLAWPYHVFHYANRDTLLAKVDRLLHDFSFCTMKEFAQAVRLKDNDYDRAG